MSSTLSDSVRLGVIGAGWFASRRHMPDAKAHPRTEIAAFCRRDPEARAKLAHRFEISPELGFEDWQEMLDKVELDAVLVATPESSSLSSSQGSARTRPARSSRKADDLALFRGRRTGGSGAGEGFASRRRS